MKPTVNPGFADRIKAQQESKKALLARFQPKPTVVADNLVDRATRKAQELEGVRRTRVEERERSRIERAAAAEAFRLNAVNAEQAALDAKRAERKERKATMRSDAQSKRAARLAMYARSASSDG